MRDTSKRGILAIAILSALALASFYLVWFVGEKNAIANKSNSEIQVLSGTASGYNGEINAVVSYEQGRIIDLEIISKETGGETIEQLVKAIISNGSTNGVDVVTGATYTSKAVFHAIADASSKLILE